MFLPKPRDSFACSASPGEDVLPAENHHSRFFPPWPPVCPGAELTRAMSLNPLPMSTGRHAQGESTIELLRAGLTGDCRSTC